MTKTIHTNKWLRAVLAIVVLLGVLLCSVSLMRIKAETEMLTIHFDLNGGSIGSGDYRQTVRNFGVGRGQTMDLPYDFDTSPKPGQAIGGWCYNKECTGEVLNGSHAFDKETTLYAKWVDGWTVTVDMGEGAAYNESAKGAVEKGKEITLHIPSLKTNPLPNGKMFCGIYTGPNGTGDCLLEYDKIALGQNFDVYSGWDIDDLKYTPTKDTTLYAYWAEPITLTFDVNGGNDLGIYNYSAYKTIEETDTKVIVQALPPTNTEGTNAYMGDVRFLGWSTDKNAKTPMDTSKLKESSYLYAVYPELWKVTVDMTEGAEYNQEYTCYAEKGYLVHVNIPELAKNPLPNGNSYAGVYTGKNGTGERVGRSSTLSFDYTPTKDTTLYVFWSKPIEVTFDANGGDLLVTYGYSEERGESYTINDYPGNIQDRHVFIGVREGYNFLGWSKNKNATQPDESLAGQQTSQWDIRESGTYYAVWQDENDVPAKFEYKVLDESKKTAVITGYEGKKKILEIPKSIDGYTIVEIGENALAYNFYYEQVILPDTITTIGDYAFCSSDSLKEIDLPSSIKKIGTGAFDGCSSLESITIPENVTLIEDGTFYSNSSLKQVNLNSKITRIGNSAFRGCSSLDKVTIPSSVTTIDDAAFFGCDSLKEVTIPASVKSIGTMAFGYHFREGTEQEAKAQENIKRPEFYETHQGGKGDGGPMIYFVFDTYKDFVIKGYSETAAEKYANENKIKFVDLDGKLNGFVKGPDGKWAIYKNGKVDTSATGIYQNENGWWRVENGYVNFKANGIYQNEYGWWKTTNGKVTFKETGVFQNENGWWRVKDSKVDFKANGIYQNKNGWWKTTNGKVTFKETGVFQNENGWWRVKDSKVDFKANGIYQNQYGWWKTTNGKVTFKENGIFQNEHGWWVVKDSKVDFGANGFYKKGNEIWKFTDGKITFKENGTYASNDGKTVYRVKDSKVDTKDTGVYPFGNDMLKFTNGVCNYKENGIFKNNSGIWYLKDSKVDTDFTGFASNNDGTWYFENGKVNTKKTGTFLIEGENFTLKNGELV